MKKLLPIVTMALICLCFACFGLAIAADTAATAAAPATAPAALAALLRETLFPFVSDLALGFLSLFLTRLGQKYKIEALTQQNNIVERLVSQGIALAEEKAAQLVGSKAALTGNEKLDIAITHVCNAMPKFTREQAEAMIHAMLGQTPNVGATGEKAVNAAGQS